MRVLHLCAGNMYGGIERLLVTLARERAACAQMQPEFAACFEGRLTEELRATGVPVHILGPVRFSRPWMVSRARRALRMLLQQEHFDVAVTHACWPHMLFGPTVVAANQTLVLWSHDLLTGKTWIERLARRTTPSRIVVASEFSGSTVRRLFPTVDVSIIHCPVSKSQVTDPSRARAKVRREFLTDENCRVIALASRLELCKGHKLLLAALSQLKTRNTRWECWIAGGAQRPKENAYLKELQSLAAGYRISPRVKWLGQRSDVDRVLAAADIYCQPNSEPEAFGIALVEAMHAGLPIVTTELGPAREIVSEACGAVVPPEPAAVADALRRMIEDSALAAQLGAAGPRRAIELCDPGGCLSRLATTLAQKHVQASPANAA